VLWIRIGFYGDPDPFFISMWIWNRIQGAKPLGILAVPDPGQSLKSQEVKFLHEKFI
jgi:streptogramin lyase